MRNHDIDKYCDYKETVRKEKDISDDDRRRVVIRRDLEDKRQLDKAIKEVWDE